jgi:hypothetical protein
MISEQVRRNVKSQSIWQDQVVMDDVTDKISSKNIHFSVTDILKCQKVPVLNDAGVNNVCSKSTKPNMLRLDSSPDVKKHINLKRLENEKRIAIMDKKLADALELIDQSKQIIDPSRLIYEAARIFDSLKIYDRASSLYLKATKKYDSEIVVDTVQLMNDEIFNRKIERMSSLHLKDFLANRNEIRTKLVFEESERQRLRSKFSYFHLFRINLLHVDFDVKKIISIQTYLCNAFKLCSGEEEHLEMLLVMHSVVKSFVVSFLFFFSQFIFHIIFSL